jgi:monothiol glutaredoxin
MNDSLKQRIDTLVKNNDVVLFMKGTPNAPQCGFSAQVAGILNELLPKYASENVLADPDLRDGIKEYSDWPTIPQLYVRGEFVGGCDIVKDLYKKGELHKMLGVKVEEVTPPSITVTDSAKAALAKALADAGNEPLHLAISDHFDSALDVGPREGHEIEVVANGITLLMDRATAKRANGLKIDFVQGAQTGFKLDNPNAPPRVKQISVGELKALLDAGRPVELYDVRGEDERAVASLTDAPRFARLLPRHHLSRAILELLEALPDQLTDLCAVLRREDERPHPTDDHPEADQTDGRKGLPCHALTAL